MIGHRRSRAPQEFGSFHLGTRRGLIKAGAIGAAGLALAGGRPSIAFAGPAPAGQTRLLSLRQGVTDAPWAASHGLDGDAYQAEFDRLVSSGFRLRRLCGYVVDGVARYASIWDQSPGPAWVGRHGLDAAAYQAAFDEYGGQGYRLIDVSGYELDGSDHYAAIWEEDPGATWSARHGLSADDYQATFDEFVAAGLRPLHVNGYTVGGQDRFATIWVASDGRDWFARHGLDGDAYQTAFDEYGADGFQPVDISGYAVGGADYYAAIWERASVGWVASHGLDADAYQAAFDEYGGQNFKLRSISGFASSDGAARYAAVWELPEGVEFAGTTGVDGLDNVVRRSFDASGVPGLSIAIAKDGRLVYAKAFGLADRDAGEALETSHRFRIASVSKPITSVAIMTLIEAGQLGLDDTIFGNDGILGNDYGTNPYSRRMRAITVHHLLEHTAGWTNDLGDPMFERTDLFGDEFVTWALDTYPPVNVPGDVHTYSNFGYCLLGRVIEYVSGQAYESYVLDNVLGLCGITSMQIAGDTLADRAAGEVVYDATNSTIGSDPYALPVARMDAHGGWIATATDLVRFAVRVDRLDTVPDILADATIADMIDPSAVNSSYAKGWITDNPDTWWHNGALAGTESILVRTIDGFCYSAIINGNGLDLYSLVSGMVQSLSLDDWPEGDPL